MTPAENLMSCGEDQIRLLMMESTTYSGGKNKTAMKNEIRRATGGRLVDTRLRRLVACMPSSLITLG